MRRILAAAFFVCTAFAAQAVTYYISQNGNDNNSGTSASSPWKTIQRLQQVMYGYGPGDQILFERGGIYSGTVDIPGSGTASNPIVVGAYGTGDAPIISGGVPVTNWVQHSGNIWRASLSTAPKYVMVNNQLMTLARYPNSGWLWNSSGSNSHITCSQLNQSSNYWQGATVVIRSTNWSYETSTVTSSSSNGTINFNQIVYNLGNNNWGFFLAGKLAQLDMAGEWYYDANSDQLYLWAPNNSNPNNLTVHASIYEKGAIPYWQRQHIRIENLVFQGQTNAGISTETSNNVIVTNCEFRYCYTGITSSGSQNQYINNTFHNTFATAIRIYDTNSLVQDNIFTDIAQVPGLGESNWGYMGINATGSGTVIRGNRLTNIGYIGITVRNNILVEKNVVTNATNILNDGAGIAFDNCDGAMIQDNLVLDCEGDLESVATTAIEIYYPICFGIYFGNTSIKNTTVQRNTVARCNGAGIHVDHTMVFTGNQVKDNILFDNNVQLSISDFSNVAGTGAVSPFHVPSFNTVYSGNVMYSIEPDQLCMRQYHCYSSNWVDFGSFSNNKYFHPYEELSIMLRNSSQGVAKYFTLERWQSTYGEDAGSTRSPLRATMYTTTSELSGNLITNGTFSNSISNWTIFPTNGQVSIDHVYLDDGALKANLPNSNLYPQLSLRSPDQMSIQNGQWYRMRLSIQSDIHGIMTPAIKGISQLTGNQVIGKKDIPYSPERRDLEFYFQSNLSDQAILQLGNSIEFPRYWIDNVQLHRVTVQPVEPENDHILLKNEFPMAQQFTLPSGCWKDVNGTLLSSPVNVAAYSSKVVYRVTGSGCSVVPVASTVGAKVYLGGALNGGNVPMRTDLRTANLIPNTEPYSWFGHTPINAGQQVSSSVLQATGSQAIVDWVLLELRDPNASFNAVAKYAALVKANGEIISPTGATQIEFPVATQGKHLAVRHRNHLPAMTASPIANNGQVIDFTTSATLTYGSGARMNINGFRALWPGDVNSDGMVSYTNAGNDRDVILIAIGAVVPSNTTVNYSRSDVNMDGVIKYTGAGNDRDVILTTIGGIVPTAVKLEQMP